MAARKATLALTEHVGHVTDTTLNFREVLSMSIPQSGGAPIEHYSQLAELLEKGCKPKEAWRIGTEHEKFGYCQDSLKPLPYDGERSIKAGYMPTLERPDATTDALHRWIRMPLLLR